MAFCPRGRCPLLELHVPLFCVFLGNPRWIFSGLKANLKKEPHIQPVRTGSQRLERDPAACSRFELVQNADDNTYDHGVKGELQMSLCEEGGRQLLGPPIAACFTADPSEPRRLHENQPPIFEV